MEKMNGLPGNFHQHPDDPYVWLAQDLLLSAVRAVREHWQPEKPLESQNHKFNAAFNFILYGSAKTLDPLVFHHLCGLSCLCEFPDMEALLISPLPGMEPQGKDVNEELRLLQVPTHD